MNTSSLPIQRLTESIGGCATCDPFGYPGRIPKNVGGPRPLWVMCPEHCTPRSRWNNRQAQRAARRAALIRQDQVLGEALAAAHAAAVDAGTTPGPWNPLEVLMGGLERSRMHPVARLNGQQLGAGAYKLITRRMGGEHRWIYDGEQPQGGEVLTLDRNGSFPSSCSSVPLPCGALTRTGALPNGIGRGNDRRAGIFRIAIPQWTDPRIGHPLGVLAEGRAGHAWITTPHLLLLDRLARAGAIAAVAIEDSYTARSTPNLLKPLYDAYAAERPKVLAAGDPDAYKAFKRRTSQALALLWPIEASSPINRPDWRVSMVAEASVRHWAWAWKAVAQDVMVLRLGSVDETDVWTPDGAVPAPYRHGTGLGEVDIKPPKGDAS
jgi:hypothetical protein